MNIKMSSEQFNKIWRSSDLPLAFRERIVGEIDMLMYDDDPIDLTDNAANTRRLLADLRYRYRRDAAASAEGDPARDP